MSGAIKTINKVSKFSAVAAAVALALSANANAGTESKQGPTKRQAIGMASGAAAGALIAGPFGAVAGFIVGTIAGTHAQEVHNTELKAATLESQLAMAKQDLVAAQTALAEVAEKPKESPAGDNQIFDQLAQRLRADVLFKTASAELDESNAQKLKDLGAVLAKYPTLTVEIDGYADPRGKAAENMELSQRRASAVRAALLIGGALPESVRVVAHGEELSTATKGDMDAYAWERRVSFAVVSSSTGDKVAQTK